MTRATQREVHNAIVFKVTDKSVIMAILESGKFDHIKESSETISNNGFSDKREFPKSLFHNDIKEGDSYGILISGGSGWMQVDFVDKVRDKENEKRDDEASIDFLKKILESQEDFDFVEKCKNYAIEQHNRVNQKYGGKPYYFHLKDVVDNIIMFIDLVPRKHRANIIGGGWNHDTIEDTAITWNDLKKATNEQVANLAYAVSNEKGKNRKERANKKYYRGIRNEMFADIIKFADRGANLRRSFENFKKDPLKAGSMFDKYSAEHPDFVWSIIKPEWYELSEQILHLFMGHKKYLKHRIETHYLRPMIEYMDKLLNQKP